MGLEKISDRSKRKRSPRSRAAKDQKVTGPSPGAAAAKRASAGLGTSEPPICEDWFQLRDIGSSRS